MVHTFSQVKTSVYINIECNYIFRSLENLLVFTIPDEHSLLCFDAFSIEQIKLLNSGSSEQMRNAIKMHVYRSGRRGKRNNFHVL